MKWRSLILMLALATVARGIDQRYIAPQVNTVDMVAYYKLWAGFTSADSVFDYSLNGNAGAVTTATPTFPGFTFDGSDGVIIVTAASELTMADKSGTTFACWMNAASDGESDSGRIFQKGDNFLFNVQSEAASLVKLRSVYVTTGDDAQSVLDTGISINTWHHVVSVRDGNDTIIYVDGVAPAQTQTTADTAFADDSSNDLGIGRETGDSRNTFDGKLDDVMYFKTAKTAVEVRNIYELTKWRYKTNE